MPPARMPLTKTVRIMAVKYDNTFSTSKAPEFPDQNRARLEFFSILSNSQSHSRESASPPLSDTSIRTSYLLRVEGYLSGASTVLSSRESIELADTDAMAIQGWMTKYCSDHPLDSLQLAAMSLV